MHVVGWSLLCRRPCYRCKLNISNTTRTKYNRDPESMCKASVQEKSIGAAANSALSTDSESSFRAATSKTVKDNEISILKVLYVVATFLSIFMVAWIVIFPSSWLMGQSDLHDHIVNEVFVKTYDGTQVPPGTITKYAGHSLIQFTHILPGAIWAGAIPFQLHPTARRKYRKFHRITGYAFLTTSILMAVGIVAILARDLTFHNDYPSHIPPVNDAELLQTNASMILLTGWFVCTATVAVVKARSKDFKSHRNFIIRHVGSGIWIALQRIVVVSFQGLGLVSGPLQMRNLFGGAATGCTFVTILTSEYVVHLLKKYDGTDAQAHRKQL